MTVSTHSLLHSMCGGAPQINSYNEARMVLNVVREVSQAGAALHIHSEI